MAGKARINFKILKEILVSHISLLEDGFYLNDIVDAITPIYREKAGDSTRKSALNDFKKRIKQPTSKIIVSLGWERKIKSYRIDEIIDGKRYTKRRKKIYYLKREINGINQLQ
tara:strand:- start:83 stop:421 length:339 start_codon:yes stop_codon:yes gene_type:complete